MSIKNNNKNRILPVLVFIGGVLVYLLAVLPFLIYRKGLFFYYGDYNVQQVPFLTSMTGNHTGNSLDYCKV